MKRGKAEIPGGAQENASRHIPEDLEGGQQNSPGSTTEEKISLFPLLVVNFINTLGFSIVLPFLVFLVNRFGGNAFVYGLASSMYPTFQLIGAPILGRWSDIYGRKKILILCQIGTLISWIIFLGALYLPLIILFKVDSKILGAFTFTLPLAILFFARALDGLTGGDVSIANAYLADTTSEKDRNRNFGKMSIAINLGFVVGPAFAGILSITEYGVVAPVLGAIVISLIGMVLLVFYIRESRQCSVDPTGAEKQQKCPGNEAKECVTAEEETVKPSFREILKLPNVPYMLGLNFLIDLSYNIFYTSFPLACDSRSWMGPCTAKFLLYNPVRFHSNRAGSCAFVGFKKVPGLKPHNLRKPDVGNKLSAAYFGKFLPDLPCNSIFRAWRRPYVAFFPLSVIKSCREKISGYSTRICQ